MLFRPKVLVFCFSGLLVVAIFGIIFEVLKADQVPPVAGGELTACVSNQLTACMNTGKTLAQCMAGG